MPPKGSKLSKEHKKNLSKAWDYNKHFTKECRNNISKANKGKIRTDEAKEKYSLAKLGKSHPPWNKGLTIEDERVKKYIDKRKSGKGFKHSEETKIKMSLISKGRNAWNKGKIFPEWSRENHPNWLGGKSFEPYGLNFNKIFKKAIKMRDNESCIICGKNNRLHIHHIDYNKLNTCKENCITLCNNCHTKTNFNREHWIKFFQSYLEKNYGYNFNIIQFQKI